MTQFPSCVSSLALASEPRRPFRLSIIIWPSYYTPTLTKAYRLHSPADLAMYRLHLYQITLQQTANGLDAEYRLTEAGAGDRSRC